MLSLTRTPLADVLPYFATRGVDVAFLVPTETGYAKSIMDATAPVRDFLSRTGIHDYDSQAQGPDAKHEYPAVLVLGDSLRETTASLYRPATKSGDPRIWLRGLKEYCAPTDLLALVAIDDQLYVFDLSDASVIDSLESNGLAASLLDHAAQDALSVAAELLTKLKAIARLGFVETLVPGPTGIGMTLEYLLGITANSDKGPDYKGIEIKATRQGGRRSTNRVNLFSQVPDWPRSALTERQILDIYGYLRIGRRQLYCTVSASKVNSQGLYFALEEDEGLLRNRSDLGGIVCEVAQWDTGLLRTRLDRKHAETFWVKAECGSSQHNESFKYTSVVHTRKPNTHLLEALLASGIITMDYTLSQGPTAVRNHGYLFKILPSDVSLLFPDPVHYDLAEA